MHDEGFCLTIFLNTELDLPALHIKLLWLQEHLAGKAITVILFCGEPMVSKFGEVKITPRVIIPLMLRLIDLFGDRVSIDIYTDLICHRESIDQVVASLKEHLCWRFTPSYYSPHSSKSYFNFIENFEYLYNTPYLGETSFIIFEKRYFIDLQVFQNMLKTYPDAKVTLTPKQGEEEYFFKTVCKGISGRPAFKLVYDDSKISCVCYNELLGKSLNSFKHFRCDTSKHAVLDMRGNLYSCMSGFADKTPIYVGFDKTDFLTKLDFFICSYDACTYDDSMSVSL